jgi:hypothetical protein
MNGTPASPRLESAQSAKVPTLTSREKVTQGRIKELFDYQAGYLVWKTHAGNGVRGGAVAGYLSTHDGYSRIMVDGTNHLAHRLVWLFHHGYFPEKCLDHINRDRADNRIENLREASHSCNLRNTGNRRNNTSGIKGVSWNAARGQWLAHITVAGKLYNLGLLEDFTEAVCLRLAAEQSLGWAGCDSSSPAYQYVQQKLGITCPPWPKKEKK